MDKTLLQETELQEAEADWFRALILRERLADSHDSAWSSQTGHTLTDDRLGDRRTAKWAAQRPFDTGDFLQRRLAADNLIEDQLRQLLGESVEHLQSRIEETPDWLASLLQAYRAPRPTKPLQASLPPQLKDARIAFLEVFSPVIQRGWRRLFEGLQEIVEKYPAAPFDPASLWGGFTIQLVRELVLMVTPTLVLELHVAKLEDRLTGATSEEQFASFAEQLQQEEPGRKILHEYPVLARQVAQRVEQWSEICLEIAQRLAHDLPDIRQRLLDGEDPGKVVELKLGLGDRHEGGRSVLTLRFSSGKQLVYKPRSLAVDRAFQDLLGWCNPHLSDTPFRLFRFLDRGTHGWVEFISTEECQSDAEVERFFRRQGQYLALLHALRATDFHFENLIAAGEHPMLVDLESVFHPHIAVEASPRIDNLAGSLIDASVITTGLLPLRMFMDNGSEGVDVSALGAQEDQLTPQAVPIWKAAGTADMHLRRERVPFTSTDHVAKRDGKSPDVLEYHEALIAGFEKMYRLLLSRRDELLAADGPLASFSNCRVRVILRPTRTYFLLLQESFHPDLLRDALDRDLFFDKLWLDVETHPVLEALIPCEQASMALGDVPIFWMLPQERSLRSGSDVFPGFFERSPLGLVRERIGDLSEEDLAQQRWIIRASIAALYPEREGEPVMASQLTRNGRRLPAADPCLASAYRIGDHLAERVIRRSGDIGWTSMHHAGPTLWKLHPAEIDLFEGLPGIALFLAYLDDIVGEERYRRLAEETLSSLRRQLARCRDEFTYIGAFEGWGGAIYLLSHLATLWSRPELLDEARSMVSHLDSLISQDTAFDVIQGAAGAIGALLVCHQVSDQSNALATAVRCGEHLLSRMSRQEQGVAWESPTADRPAAGFAHGTAGIAWALLELAVASGEESFAKAAEEAIAYERHLFSPAAGNWPAPGGEEREAPFMAAWCYGAAGIGLARIEAGQHLEDPRLAQEVAVAVRTTLARGFGLNHSLNQGDLGNLELIQRAADETDLVASSELHGLSDRIATEIATVGPRCATPLAIETPGLMTGLSGIGYGLLRLGAPDRLPSVLLLEGPRER